MNLLGDLIERRRTELGLSWYDIAKRGRFKSHTIVYSVAHGELRQAPRRTTLERIAKALDLPLDLVLATAAAAVGLLPPVSRQDEDIRIVVHTMASLSADKRAEFARSVAEGPDTP